MQNARLAKAQLGRQPLPIVVEHGHTAAAAPLQHQPKRFEGPIRRQQPHTQSGKAAFQPCGHARPGPRAPLQGHHRPSPVEVVVLVVMRRKTIEGPIGGPIAGLAWRPQQGRHRGKNHAKIWTTARRLTGLLQELLATPLDPQHRGLASWGLGLKQTVIQHASGVEHPGQGLAAQDGHQRLRRAAGQIQKHHLAGHTGSGESIK